MVVFKIEGADAGARGGGGGADGNEDEDEDEVSRHIEAHADDLFSLPPNLNAASEVIRQQRLDLIIYPELGLDPVRGTRLALALAHLSTLFPPACPSICHAGCITCRFSYPHCPCPSSFFSLPPPAALVQVTYFLAFARLAPAQVAWWGHPDTSVRSCDCALICGLVAARPCRRNALGTALTAAAAAVDAPQGIPTVDYFVSSEMEASEADAWWGPHNSGLFSLRLDSAA